MILQSPYRNSGHWYRGSLHIHSTFSSCGWHGIEELALAYRDYTFLAVSDHDRITTETDALKNHVIFRGVEVSGNHHMLLVGLTPPTTEPVNNEFSVAHYGELAAATTRSGGLAVASHPMRLFGQHWSSEELLMTDGLIGMEIYSGDGIHVDQDIGFEMWDQVLSQGKRLWGFGNDDFHHWGQERRVWNVVNASDQTPQAIMEAMRHGDFYVSTGFGFPKISVEDDRITYVLRSDTPQYKNTYKYLTLYGKNGQILAEKTGRFEEFTYQAQGDEGYIRAEAYMSGGYAAISQPIFVLP